jgi:hypothetical protein
MTTIYVDNIAPNLQSKISAPNLTLPAGSIVQVVNATATGNVVATSTTYVDLSGMSLNITPTSASSKILIQYIVHSFNGGSGNGNSLWGSCGIRLLRGSTPIHSDNDSFLGSYGTGINAANGNDRIMTRDSFTYLDSPNSTSQLTYKIQGCELQDRGTSQVWFNAYGAPGTIMAMEIAQ